MICACHMHMFYTLSSSDVSCIPCTFCLFTHFPDDVSPDQKNLMTHKKCVDPHVLTKIVPSHIKSNKQLEWIKWLVHNSYKNKDSAHLCSRLLQNLNSILRLVHLSKENSYLKSYLVHGTSVIVKDIFAWTLLHHLSEFVHLGSWMIYFILIFNSVCMC